MIYRKPLHTKNAKRLRLTLADFSGGLNDNIDENLLPFKYAKSAFNFDGSSGALKNGRGFKKLQLKNLSGEQRQIEFAGNVLKTYYYRRFDPYLNIFDDIIIVYCSDKKLYFTKVVSNETSFTLIDGITFDSAPIGINYKLNSDDVIIFCSETDPMTVWDYKNAAYLVETAPKISSACIHYERLFVTVDGEKSAVWFSDDLDPTSWDISLDQAGFIEMSDGRGSLLKVVQFLDYVYIFRSYGIARLTAYADQTQFSLMPLYVSSGKIFAQTICQCGDRIIFMASDGFYVFNGLSTSKILENVYPKLIPTEDSCASFFNGKYYLTCRLKAQNNTDAENCILEYDVKSGNTVLMRGINANNLCVIMAENFSTLVANVEGVGLCNIVESGELDGMALLKVWETAQTDFNYPDELKLIREIFVYTKTDVSFACMTDQMSKIVHVKGGKGIKKVAVNIRGKTFKLRILCDEKLAEISKPQITVDII